MEFLEPRRLLTVSTFTVTTTADNGPGSLRQAILDLNNDIGGGHDLIQFAIPGSGAHKITLDPDSPLNPIIHEVTIDGTTQSGYIGTPLIWLDGINLIHGTPDGLVVTPGNSTVTGLSITNFRHGAAIHLTTNGSDTISFNYLGVQPSGSGLSSSFFNIDGVVADSNSNQIHDNLLSGNDDAGALINGAHNVLTHNFIGTDSKGTSAVPNSLDGIKIVSGDDTTIGGTSASLRNVISGNSLNGIALLGAGSAQIQGNFIGTDVSGLLALSNQANGVYVNSAGTSVNVVVGGTSSSKRNIISGNKADGVAIEHADGVLVQGNYIGTDLTGALALPNSNGVGIYGASSNNTIGGAAVGASNLISGNDADGVHVFAANTTTGNLVQANFIGTDFSGTLAVPNAQNGITLQFSATATGNLISGNLGDGIDVFTGNTVTSNHIGTQADFTSPLGNDVEGVAVLGDGNSIASNTLANSGDAGVAVYGGTGNTIRFNSIYANGAVFNGICIDLNDDGPTLNDSVGHVGPNNYQNFPVIAAAISSAGSISIDGSLSANPTTVYIIDFYANPAADPSGYGQGKNYLGSITITTNAGGAFAFSGASFSLPAGQTIVSATATDPGGNTSEFSADFTIVPTVGSTEQSRSQSLSFPYDPNNASLPHTNWDNTQSIDQFDPTLGTLNSIDVIDNGMITVNIGVENDSSLPDTFTMTVTGNVSLSGPSLTTAMGPVNLSPGPFDLGAFDGNDDFMGASGHTFGPLSSTASISVTLTGADMLPYIGLSTVSFRDVATASASGDGGGSFTAFADSFATGQVTVIYHYTPVASVPHAPVPAFIHLSSDAQISNSITPAGRLMSITAGTVTFDADASNLAPNFDLMVSPGASAIFNAPQHLHSLTLAGNATAKLAASGNNTLVLADSLFIDSTHGASLDIANNSVIINYAAQSPANDIRAYLLTGRNAQPAHAAPWNGNGIRSSYATTNGNGFNLAIGYADNVDVAAVRASGSYTSFGGQTVSRDAVLIRLTRGADATLDGIVDGQDVAVIGTHFDKPNSASWVFGDFDYSGLCDGSDIAVLGTTFGKSSPTLSPAHLLSPLALTTNTSSTATNAATTTTTTSSSLSSNSTTTTVKATDTHQPPAKPIAAPAVDASSTNPNAKLARKKSHPFNLLQYITQTD